VPSGAFGGRAPARLAGPTGPHVLELRIGCGRQALLRPPAIELLSRDVHESLRLDFPIIKARPVANLFGRHHVVLHAIGRRAALQPQFDGFRLGAQVVAAHQRIEMRMGFIAGFLETAQLHATVDGLPLGAVDPRPSLTCARLALHACGDVRPRMPRGPKLGGNGQKRVKIATHDVTPCLAATRRFDGAKRERRVGGQTQIQVVFRFRARNAGGAYGRRYNRLSVRGQTPITYTTVY
jgi:hypothetical protein